MTELRSGAHIVTPVKENDPSSPLSFSDSGRLLRRASPEARLPCPLPEMDLRSGGMLAFSSLEAKLASSLETLRALSLLPADALTFGGMFVAGGKTPRPSSLLPPPPPSLSQ